ncbi:MAG: hypothetical protein GX879_09840, partial [Bacteroidales bacterium]|nr:hypothetical protein [Bacteroidales bacterium]
DTDAELKRLNRNNIQKTLQNRENISENINANDAAEKNYREDVYKKNKINNLNYMYVKYVRRVK